MLLLKCCNILHIITFLCCISFAGVSDDHQNSGTTPVYVTSTVQTDSNHTVNHTESSDTKTGSTELGTELSTAVRTPTQSAHWTSSTFTLNTTGLTLNITDNSSVTAKPDHVTSFITLTAVSVFYATSWNITVNTGMFTLKFCQFLKLNAIPFFRGRFIWELKLFQGPQLDIGLHHLFWILQCMNCPKFTKITVDHGNKAGHEVVIEMDHVLQDQMMSWPPTQDW